MKIRMNKILKAALALTLSASLMMPFANALDENQPNSLSTTMTASINQEYYITVPEEVTVEDDYLMCGDVVVDGRMLAGDTITVSINYENSLLSQGDTSFHIESYSHTFDFGDEGYLVEEKESFNYFPDFDGSDDHGESETDEHNGWRMAAGTWTGTVYYDITYAPAAAD